MLLLVFIGLMMGITVDYLSAIIVRTNEHDVKLWLECEMTSWEETFAGLKKKRYLKESVYVSITLIFQTFAFLYHLIFEQVVRSRDGYIQLGYIMLLINITDLCILGLFLGIYIRYKMLKFLYIRNDCWMVVCNECLSES